MHDVQHHEQLALVGVDSLDVHVEERVGVDVDAHGVLNEAGELDLVGPLDVEKLPLKGRVAGVRLQPAQRLEVREPAPSHPAVDQLGELGVRVQQPTALRYPVGDALEFLGPEVVKISGQLGRDQPRMDLRDAVDGVASEHRDVAHSHLGEARLFEQADAREQRGVARPPLGHLLQQPAVELVDELEVPRQKPLDQRHRPPLQGLGGERVIGVAEGGSGDLPGVDPGDLLLVDEKAHQLDDGQGRVRIVELDGDRARQLGVIGVIPLETSHDVAHGAGDQEVLLEQA